MNGQLWAASAIIVAGYVLGFYFQRRDVEALRREMMPRFEGIDKCFEGINKRFDDLKDWIRAEFAAPMNVYLYAGSVEVRYPVYARCAGSTRLATTWRKQRSGLI